MSRASKPASTDFDISNISKLPIVELEVFCSNPNKLSKFEINKLITANGFTIKGPINTKEFETVINGQKVKRNTVRMKIMLVNNIPAYHMLMRDEKIFLYNEEGKELSLMKNKSFEEIQEYKRSFSKR